MVAVGFGAAIKLQQRGSTKVGDEVHETKLRD